MLLRLPPRHRPLPARDRTEVARYESVLGKHLGHLLAANDPHGAKKCGLAQPPCLR